MVKSLLEFVKENNLKFKEITIDCHGKYMTEIEKLDTKEYKTDCCITDVCGRGFNIFESFKDLSNQLSYRYIVLHSNNKEKRKEFETELIVFDEKEFWNWFVKNF